MRGIEEAKRILEEYNKTERQKLDPGGRYERIHTLIQLLAEKNDIAPETLDKELDLNDNYTRLLFTNIRKTVPSVDIMKKYLNYFGLQEYLYTFQNASPELRKYLDKRKELDTFRLKSKVTPGAERFVLKEIKRGKDMENEGAFIYRLTLESIRGNTEEVVVSNPLEVSLVIGRAYQLKNRDGTPRTEDVQPPNSVRDAEGPSDDECRRIQEELASRNLGRTRARPHA